MQGSLVTRSVVSVPTDDRCLFLPRPPPQNIPGRRNRLTNVCPSKSRPPDTQLTDIVLRNHNYSVNVKWDKEPCKRGEIE